MEAINPLDNHGLVCMVVEKQLAKAPWMDRDETYGDAWLAMCEAARAYDPERGVAFSTYAVATMRNKVRDSSWKNVVMRGLTPTRPSKNVGWRQHAFDADFSFDRDSDDVRLSSRDRTSLEGVVASATTDERYEPITPDQLSRAIDNAGLKIKEVAALDYEKTPSMIARELGVTKQAVHQWRTSALEKLRKYLGLDPSLKSPRFNHAQY